jgi:hypothetical protein
LAVEVLAVKSDEAVLVATAARLCPAVFGSVRVWR